MKNYLYPVLSALILLGSCKKELNNNGAVSEDDQDSSSATISPNIILVMADDIGYEVPSYTGGNYETPNIDFMARNGLQFCEFRATPLCNPSRIELLTGKYGFRNYIDWGTMSLTDYAISNFMKSAGYKTCISGKWQLGGADTILNNQQWDAYRVWDAYTPHEGFRGVHYRNPTLFENGINTTYANNEYGEDLIRDYLFDFIDNAVASKEKFFCLWTPNLAHEPFQPTPDDPEYLTFDNGPESSDVKYFPSMVKYLDKQMGMLLNHIDSLKLTNTYVIFLSDNGTPSPITSMWKGKSIRGGKGKTAYSWGTHVPMIVYKRDGGVRAGVDSTIGNLSDIFATVAEAIDKRLPDGQIFDGISFWPQVKGLANPAARTWSFTDFHPKTTDQPQNWSRWVEDRNYRLYDSAYPVYRKNRMYKTIVDSSESNFLKNLTPEEVVIQTRFKAILDSLHK